MSDKSIQVDELDEILKAVYGCGRNSRLRLSDHEPLETWMSVDQAKQAVEALIQQKQLEAVENARSKDPHKCEFGHTVYSHNTADGWCCACEADIAFLNAQLSTPPKKEEK